jgi:stearoyl-CoA desaturase (Delta-9 desaturase)
MPIPVSILFFLAGHWLLSIFFQTFFLHRYGAHKMFTLSPGWERFFHLCTFVTQGSSYLNPRAYAILHRMHHAYADTELDPHSPAHTKNPMQMMNRTRDIYRGIMRGTFDVEPRFLGGYPEWPLLDRIGNRWPTSIAFGTLYTAFYLQFATAWWQFLLLPVHFMMGPIHGSIVNWFGHWAGYRNFATKDVSRNTLPFDFVTMGELFQNNHHAHGSCPNFASRRFELDPTWPVIWLLDKLGVLELRERRHANRQHENAPEPAE